MNWLWQLLTDPLSALDLRGRDGRASWTKLVSVLLAALFVFLIVRNPGWPPWGQTVTFIAGIFGANMFRLFLERWHGQASEQRNVTQTERPGGASTEQWDDRPQ